MAAAPVLGVTTVLYTIPSLALFSLLVPVFGISASVVVTGLTHGHGLGFLTLPTSIYTARRMASIA